MTTDTVRIEAPSSSLVVIPGNLVADIGINMSGIKYQKMDISRMSTDIHVKQRCAQILDATFESNVGNAYLDAFYAARTKQDIKTGFCLDLKDVTSEEVIALMPQISSVMPMIESIKGKLNCEVAVTAELDTTMNIRMSTVNGIARLGGKYPIETKNGQIDSIFVQNTQSNEQSVIKTKHLLLCVGHSARETFEMLYNKNIVMQQKPFAMGVRIEQKQKDINLAQYGAESIDGLPNADYKLVAHLPNGRSVFTFCMCPGGQVVASSSEEGSIVTNGMSDFARDKENANSAVLVNVVPEDYGSTHPLAGIYYQADFERRAFEIAGGNYNAPAQSVGEFVKGKKINTDINYTYRPNLTMCGIKDCLPDFVAESLKLGLPVLNQKLKGFAKDENLLIAIESRSSCPLTIVRDENYESNIKGLYPVGEGAGYAGGIMSSAQDGIKVAESIYNRL